MSFDLQPTLKGVLVELRPLTPGDFDVLYAVASDPLIWEQHPANDRHKEDDVRIGRVIGSSRFYGYDEQRSEIEIGWTFLARSHWGGVYNKELKELMLHHAFRFVTSVVFFVGASNLRSQRAMQKIGGVRIESRRDATGVDRVVFQITASAFFLIA